MDMKMDLKDLGQKIKNNRAAKIALGGVVIIIVALVCVLVLTGGDEAAINPDTVPSGQAPEGQKVETLPNTERVFDEAKAIGSGKAFSDEDMGFAEVTGIVVNSDGKATAIIQTANASYIAEAGKKLGSTGWSVKEVSASGVTVFSGDKTRFVPLADVSPSGSAALEINEIQD